VIAGATSGWTILSAISVLGATVLMVLIPFVTWFIRHERKKAMDLEALESAKAKKQDALYIALLGQDPTLDDPTPPPGVLERLSNMEDNQAVLAQRLDDQARLLADVKKEVTPNGGNTSRLGDRIVKIEKHLGVADD